MLSWVLLKRVMLEMKSLTRRFLNRANYETLKNIGTFNSDFDQIATINRTPLMYLKLRMSIYCSIYKNLRKKLRYNSLCAFRMVLN